MLKRIVILTLAVLMMVTVSACTRGSKDAEKGEKAIEQGVLESTVADTTDNTVETNTDTDKTADTGITDNTETAADTDKTAGTETTANIDKTAGTEITAVTEITPDTATVSNNDTDSGHTASQPSSIDGNAADETKNSAETISLQTNDNKNESRILEGRIICIDPGHQSHGNYDTEPVAPGSDEMKAKVSSGTAGVKTRIPEYKLNLEVSLKLRDALEKYGATVILTRTKNDVDISNAERAAIANEANADLYFRIHADGSTDKSINGVSVLIPGKGHITDKYILEESEKAGGCILKGFVEATGAEQRGMPKRNDLSGFNWCRVPMVLIEMGFMSNADEDEKLNSSEYQDKMVAGMVNGIIEYFKQK